LADNTLLNAGTGGDTIRDKDRAGVKTQIVAVDLNPAGAETLMAGVMPVSDNSGSLTVDDGGGSLTVDGTVSVSGAVPITDNSGSITVDNGGTFAVQATATQAGTWTVQPGNTANTTAWKVDASSVPVPITDNGGSLTVDAAQLPSSLTANGNLKVAMQETALPSVLTRSNKVLASDGAQTNAALVSTTSNQIVLTRLSIACSHANSVDVAVKVGFAAATLGSSTLAGTDGIVYESGAILAGGGITMGDGSGILAIGASGEDLRLTCGVPTGGAVDISYSYYTV